jgi:hypothetical protein
MSSVAGDRCVRTTAMPVRGCLKRAVVPTVTGRLIRLPASLKALEAHPLLCSCLESSAAVSVPNSGHSIVAAEVIAENDEFEIHR